MAEVESGPFFYLSKVESALEARLWDQIFTWAENQLGLQFGITILHIFFRGQNTHKKLKNVWRAPCAFVVIVTKQFSLLFLYIFVFFLCRYDQELRTYREYSGHFRDGVDIVRIASSLYRIELRHLGLFRFHHLLVWYRNIFFYFLLCASL